MSGTSDFSCDLSPEAALSGMDLVTLAPAVGVALGLGLYYARTAKSGVALDARIREELARARTSGSEPLVLPVLVQRVGLSDGFLNRGKVMSALAPMVGSGEVLQEEPEGTTVKNRLEVLRFRLR